MPFHARKSAGGDFQPVPEGSHIGVCSSLIDIGIQGGGKYPARHKLVLTWTLTNTLHEDSGKPMVISGTFTNNMSEKANLRKLVENWFGKTFPTEQAAEEFDLSLLLGRAGLVNVVHKQGAGGKIFANPVGVMQLPKGFPKPPPAESQVYYAPNDPSQTPAQVSAAYAALPGWIRTKVDAQLPEGSDDEKKLEGVAAETAAAAEAFDDDIPF